MKILINSVIAFLIVCSARSESLGLLQLRAQKEAAVKRVIAPIDAKYQGALEKLLKVLTASENLEGALAVKEELKASKNNSVKGSPSSSEKSGRLALLRKQRVAAIDQASGPITSKYILELEKLQKKMTLSGNLDQAVEVKNELLSLTGSEKNQLIGIGGSDFGKDLIGSSWEFKQAEETVLLKFGDGIFRVHKMGSDGNYSPGDTRKWKMENAKRRRVRIFWHYGEEVVSVNSKMTVMKGSKHVMKRVKE